MNLIACSNCHTQYDVTNVVEKTIPCRCGEVLENRTLEAKDATIHRCGACGAQAAADADNCDYCGSTIMRVGDTLSLICPECFGRNEENSRFCTACGVAFDPQQVETSGEELPCPCCVRLMPVRQVGGLSINECPSCNGLWVPEDRFDQLVDRAIESASSGGEATKSTATPRMKGANPAQQRVLYRKCPVCEAQMNRRNYRKTSGVIIDICSKHGTWLDADELEQIAGFITSGGRPKADRFMKDLHADEVRTRPTVAMPQRSVPTSTTDLFGRPDERSSGLDLVGDVLSLFVRLLD